MKPAQGVMMSYVSEAVSIAIGFHSRYLVDLWGERHIIHHPDGLRMARAMGRLGWRRELSV